MQALTACYFCAASSALGVSAYGSATGGQGGAGGAERLRDSAELEALVDAQRRAGRRWAALCASPAVVFESKGWLADKKATAHPAFVDRLADSRRAARVPGASRQQTGFLAHLSTMLPVLCCCGQLFASSMSVSDLCHLSRAVSSAMTCMQTDCCSPLNACAQLRPHVVLL